MLRITAACFFILSASLVAIGFVSWRRTGSLRRGIVPRARDPTARISFSSSRTTRLAALAGMAALAWGATVAGANAIQAVPLIAGGGVVALSGFAARVTEIRAGHERLVILFARRRPFVAPWSDVQGLCPPGTPIGGWRVTTGGGSRTTLMPSDLFGHEELLPLIVRRTGLRFDGRAWIGNS
jgi:hypothetical protein